MMCSPTWLSADFAAMICVSTASQSLPGLDHRLQSANLALEPAKPVEDALALRLVGDEVRCSDVGHRWLRLLEVGYPEVLSESYPLGV